jgi:hypothetical protein
MTRLKQLKAMAILAPTIPKVYTWLLPLKLMMAAVAVRLWKEAHARIAAHRKR